MLKYIVYAFIAIALPLDSCAEILKFVSARDGHAYEARIYSNNDKSSVSFYRDSKILGTYNNLVVSESSISSSLVPIVGGGIAVKIESDGSRNKYEIIAPITFDHGNLYVECLYKNMYEAVEETRSVGTSCRRQELYQFDVSAAIDHTNLSLYVSSHEWLKSLPSRSCANAVGIEIGSYSIARCAREGASETSAQKIIALDQRNRLLFSTTGYEIIPSMNSSKFFLVANLKNDAVLFQGDFSCYATESNVSAVDRGVAEIDGGLGINYFIGVSGKCLSGNYRYASKKQEISLRGNLVNENYCLLEMNVDRTVSGAFMINKAENGIQGVWLGVPPKGPLIVRER
jgi:hypothetical protein